MEYLDELLNRIDEVSSAVAALRSAINNASPYLCHQPHNDTCPNTRCWVQKVRDSQIDEIHLLELMHMKMLVIVEAVANNGSVITTEMRSAAPEMQGVSML